LRDKGWNVELQWKDQKILKWTEERLGLDLSGIEVVEDINRGAGYDLVFWLSDGSVPILFANQNIIHFQTPFRNVHGKNILNRLKFLKVSKVICNSKFTKNVIDQEFGTRSVVLYPPVPTEEFKPGKKENIILSVGRFSQLQQSKRQDVLISSFKKMCKSGLKGWKLILIGGSDVGGREYVEKLKIEAEGYPIQILEGLPFTEIKKYYAKSKIFWSASGFNIDSEKEPFRVEHFGITVVEAMSSGLVPIVVNNGGHKETIDDKQTGFLWDKTLELENITSKLIKDEKLREKISLNAQKSATIFSQNNFSDNFLKLVR
jgi:glycosyltransferase involved in cell wall biosynthesis